VGDINESQARRIIIGPTRIRGERGQRYRVRFGGEVLIEDTWNRGSLMETTIMPKDNRPGRTNTRDRNPFRRTTRTRARGRNDGAQQGCNLPGPYGGVSCGACVGFAPRALLAANLGFTYWRISFKVGSPPKVPPQRIAR
jgi:hypothetical protein